VTRVGSEVTAVGSVVAAVGSTVGAKGWGVVGSGMVGSSVASVGSNVGSEVAALGFTVGSPVLRVGSKVGWVGLTPPPQVQHISFDRKSESSYFPHPLGLASYHPQSSPYGSVAPLLLLSQGMGSVGAMVGTGSSGLHHWVRATPLALRLRTAEAPVVSLVTGEAHATLRSSEPWNSNC
jgi:hypothetical protein